MDVVRVIYFFDDNAGDETLQIKGEMYKYLVKVRRHSVGDKLEARNKKKIELLHSYEIVSIEPRTLSLRLLASVKKEVKSDKNLHVGWCMIDSKSIEKVLPSLCEMGVSKISFISCDRSQKNFKLDFKRLDRIVEASMQQSGRSTFMEFDTYKNIQSFLSEFPETKVFDFTDTILEEEANFSQVLIGCEGGFSPSEKELFEPKNVFRLKTEMVLRSESALLAVSSKILL